MPDRAALLARLIDDDVLAALKRKLGVLAYFLTASRAALRREKFDVRATVDGVAHVRHRIVAVRRRRGLDRRHVPIVRMDEPSHQQAHDRAPEGRLELMTGIRERRFFDRGTKPGAVSGETANKALEPA